MMIVIMSTTSTLNKTPMSILMGVVSMSVVVTFSLIMNAMSYWMAFLLVLTYISGMMVLFMYVTSLIPNEKSLFKFKKVITMGLLMTPILFLMNQNSPIMKNVSTNFMMNTFLTLSLITLISIMIIVPPKMIFSSNKGMKTSE